MARIKIRIEFDESCYLAHGRIQLLELIGEHGSIAQAAKAMNMSYKRAWYLADAVNEMFDEPLIARRHGGKGGGSAELTALGQAIVREYRAMEADARSTFAAPIRRIGKRLAGK